ncbi:MAG TPA: hypothetical protein QGF05_07385 [Dehalococcoidia bacterium]|nr:hypothetical protein [Dehalococcoidia bacterium]
MIALALLLAWLPALTFAGHWSGVGDEGVVGEQTSVDTVFLALVPHTHGLAGGAVPPTHLHAGGSATPAASNDVNGGTVPGADPYHPSPHAEHGHGGAGATGIVAAIVPQPVSVETMPMLVAAEAVLDETPPAPHSETPPAPPPRTTIV